MSRGEPFSAIDIRGRHRASRQAVCDPVARHYRQIVFRGSLARAPGCST